MMRVRAMRRRLRVPDWGQCRGPRQSFPHDLTAIPISSGWIKPLACQVIRPSLQMQPCCLAQTLNKCIQQMDRPNALCLAPVCRPWRQRSAKACRMEHRHEKAVRAGLAILSQSSMRWWQGIGTLLRVGPATKARSAPHLAGPCSLKVRCPILPCRATKSWRQQSSARFRSVLREHSAAPPGMIRWLSPAPRESRSRAAR